MGGDDDFFGMYIGPFESFIRCKLLCFLWQFVGPRPRFSRAHAICRIGKDEKLLRLH